MVCIIGASVTRELDGADEPPLSASVTFAACVRETAARRARVIAVASP